MRSDRTLFYLVAQEIVNLTAKLDQMRCICSCHSWDAREFHFIRWKFTLAVCPNHIRWDLSFRWKFTMAVCWITFIRWDLSFRWKFTNWQCVESHLIEEAFLSDEDLPIGSVEVEALLLTDIYHFTITDAQYLTITDGPYCTRTKYEVHKLLLHFCINHRQSYPK